jgi:hypothetical protein
VEHQVGGEHVGDVGQGPAGFLRDGGQDVVEDFEDEDEDYVDEPGACCSGSLLVHIFPLYVVACIAGVICSTYLSH